MLQLMKNTIGRRWAPAHVANQLVHGVTNLLGRTVRKITFLNSWCNPQSD